jgi:hypothetical protein
MTEKRTAGHLNDAWIEVDKTDDPSFFVRFLDASGFAHWNLLAQTPLGHRLRSVVILQRMDN